jgi:hypothetical protein
LWVEAGIKERFEVWGVLCKKFVEVARSILKRLDCWPGRWRRYQ